jgi:hypothetical protein
VIRNSKKLADRLVTAVMKLPEDIGYTLAIMNCGRALRFKHPALVQCLTCSSAWICCATQPFMHACQRRIKALSAQQTS